MSTSTQRLDGQHDFQSGTPHFQSKTVLKTPQDRSCPLKLPTNSDGGWSRPGTNGRKSTKSSMTPAHEQLPGCRRAVRSPEHSHRTRKRGMGGAFSEHSEGDDGQALAKRHQRDSPSLLADLPHIPPLPPCKKNCSEEIWEMGNNERLESNLLCHLGQVIDSDSIGTYAPA